MCFSDAAPRLLQENQKYLSQLTSLMQEAADEQAKSIVVSVQCLFYLLGTFEACLLLQMANCSGYVIKNIHTFAHTVGL